MATTRNKTSPTQRWTLALDESGRFEGRAAVGDTDERGGWVVGGVLLPGGAEETNWALDGFRQYCKDCIGGWPPHASEQSSERRRTLTDAAGDEVRRRGGAWIFVVTRARGASRAGALGRFVRMFGATVDFAGRITAALGGSELDARPAHRSIVLDGSGLHESANLGVVAAVRGIPSQGEPRARPMLEAETRHALEALGREPTGAPGAWPVLTSVVVEYAARPDSHAGLALADLGCNRVYGGLWTAAGDALQQLLTPFHGTPIFVLELDALRPLRSLDRALRQTPADLMAAARVLARLRGDARAAESLGKPDPALARGAAAAGDLLWQRGLQMLAAQEPSAAIATVLASAAEAELALKTGAYEGTWLALEGGWSGTGALATAMRSCTTDRVQAARLWRMVVECANHRGDVATALSAAAAFDVVVASGRSYRLLSEELIVRNLTVVARQNELPADGATIASLRVALADETQRLREQLEEAGQVLELVPGVEPAAGAQVSVDDDREEQRLWTAIGNRSVVWAAPDRERGMGYGTVARSLGFLGSLADAADAGLEARSLFGDSAFDRRINAAVLARIFLDAARLGRLDQRSREGLEAALVLCGARALMERASAASSILELVADSGQRFCLDIALRAYLWYRAPEPGAPLVKVLSDGSLCDRMARGELRSHPTELVARHAGELLRKHGGPEPAIARWFALSMSLSDEAAPGGTVQRLGIFTRRVARDPHFTAEGPEGSLLNPSFEYR